MKKQFLILLMAVMVYATACDAKPYWPNKRGVTEDQYPENQEVYIAAVVINKTLEQVKQICKRYSSRGQEVLLRYDPVLTGPVSMNYRAFGQDIHTDAAYVADDDFCDLLWESEPDKWVCFKASDRHLKRGEGCN